MTDVEDSIRTILIEDLFVEKPRESIAPTDSFRRDLGLDSLGFVELKTQVEKTFGIDIADDDFTPENFATIASLRGLVDRTLQAP